MKEKLRLLNLNLLNRVSITNELINSDNKITVNSMNQIKVNRARRLQTITILSNCINSLISHKFFCFDNVSDRAFVTSQNAILDLYPINDKNLYVDLDEFSFSVSAL